MWEVLVITEKRTRSNSISAITEFTFLASGDPYSDDHGDSLDSANADTLVEETTEEDTGERKGGEWVGESRIRERLERPFNSRSQDYKILLLQYLKTGKYSFDSKEVSGILGKKQNTVTAYLRKLMEEKIVTITRDRPGMTMIYSFYRGDDQFVEADYSDELISMLSSLSVNHRSGRDSIIGKALLQRIPYGYITIDTYRKFGEEEKWQSDMEFAEQIGLVKRVDESCCFILKMIDYQFDHMNEMQRKRATEMYNSFGGELFSQKMVVATLSYSANIAKAVLHEFRLLRILDCHKDGINMYQFRVNPKENPECFDGSAA